MSETIVLGIINSVSTLAGIILTLFIKNKLENVKDKIVKTNKKLDTVHEEIDGKMSLLLDTTMKLGNSQGRVEEKAEHKEEKG